MNRSIRSERSERSERSNKSIRSIRSERWNKFLLVIPLTLLCGVKAAAGRIVGIKSLVSSTIGFIYLFIYYFN